MTRILAPWANGSRYLGFRRLRFRRRDIKFGRIHRGQRNVGRMDRQTYEVGERGRLWLPTVKRTIIGKGGALTLHRGVTHLELRRSLSNGTGGKDIYEDREAEG
eukprot:scaffold6856_cov124-Isochrysis_galbana.AAC.8